MQAVPDSDRRALHEVWQAPDQSLRNLIELLVALGKPAAGFISMILEPNSEMMALSAMVVLRSSNSPTVAHFGVACLSSRCENNS
jgi:hypothetical protein